MPPRSAQTINVHLFDSYVGTISWLPTQKIVFAFSQDYIDDLNRPTLSLSFGGRQASLRTNVKPTNIRLPSFFSNLLPEGKLREYLARKADIDLSQEFFLLSELREDLPGAVVLGVESLRGVPRFSGGTSDLDGPLSFSLAGVQLKLSGNLTNQKLAIPTSGAGGRWIVKLPVPALPRINELERAMLVFAEKIGIETPETRLLSIYDLENLPKDLPHAFEGDCLLSRRFDRDKSSDRRIHAEDFCQVFGVYDKYDPQYNYQTIASVLWTEVGLHAVEEYVRRLVFMVAIGNADMHLKNWSLIYPNQRKPQLSPAYDFVPSAPIYDWTLQRLCLKLAGETDFRAIHINHFKKLAALAKLPENVIIQTANDTAESIHKVWRDISDDLGLLHSERRLIGEQINKSSLLHARRSIGVVVETLPVPARTEVSSMRFGLSGQINLDTNLPPNQIMYNGPKGDIFSLQAPRRMVKQLLMEQLHELMRENPQLNGTIFTASVNLPLFLEWREENIPRIESRNLTKALASEDLRADELKLEGVFFGSTFSQLEKMWKTHLQQYIDFEFQNTELWTTYCAVQSISDVTVLSDGRRTAVVSMRLSEVEQILPIVSSTQVSDK